LLLEKLTNKPLNKTENIGGKKSHNWPVLPISQRFAPVQVVVVSLMYSLPAAD
jgi:hypothetical protein